MADPNVCGVCQMELRVAALSTGYNRDSPSRRSLPRRVPIRTVLPGAASCHVLRDSPLYPDQLRVPLQGATGLIRTSSLRVC
jgi:hypothetical protein